MSRTNLINLVEEIYRLCPDAPDVTVFLMCELLLNQHPTDKTLATWKTTLRKKGLKIPYTNKKGKSNDTRAV